MMAKPMKTLELHYPNHPVIIIITAHTDIHIHFDKAGLNMGTLGLVWTWHKM